MACEAEDGVVRVVLGTRDGAWEPPRERVALELRGVEAAEVVVEGQPHADWAVEDGTTRVELPERAAASTVVVRTA